MTSDEIRSLVKEFRRLSESTIDDKASNAYQYCAERLEAKLPKHYWVWYMNGTFCRHCNRSIGDPGDCR